MGTPAFVRQAAAPAPGPQPASMLETSTEGLWLLQALCGVEVLPSVLVCRPFVSDCGIPAEHPGFETLRAAGVIFGEDNVVHPQVRVWMEALGAPDVVLACMVRRGDQHLRVAIARRGEMTVSVARHGDNVVVEALGTDVTVPGLVERIMPLGGPDVAPAAFDAVMVPTADLLNSLAQVLRGERSPMAALGPLGMDADQHRIVTLAADHPLAEMSIVVVTYGSTSQVEVSKAAATVTDTTAGRVVSGPVRSDSGAWWTQVSPGTLPAIKSAVSMVLKTVGLDGWAAKPPQAAARH